MPGLWNLFIMVEYLVKAVVDIYQARNHCPHIAVVQPVAVGGPRNLVEVVAAPAHRSE